jgi:hypothetical protein
MLWDACLHEGRHCGFFYAHDISVSQVEVDQAGNGWTHFATLELPGLTSLYHVDRQAACDRVINYVAGCLSGHLTSGAVPDRADVAQAQRYALLWSTLTQQPAHGVLDRAQRRAIAWIVVNRRPIEGFAHALDVRRMLQGEELQEVLRRTFGPQPQTSQPSTPAPRPVATGLGPVRTFPTPHDAARDLERFELFYGLPLTRRSRPHTPTGEHPIPVDWRTTGAPFPMRGVGRCASSWGAQGLGHFVTTL